MLVWKSTLVASQLAAEKLAASQEAQIRLLRERLEEADGRYRAVLEDLRLAVGLKQRVIQVPVEGAIPQNKPPKDERPEWNRGTTTPQSFAKAAQLELARKWAEEQQKELSEVLKQRN